MATASATRSAPSPSSSPAPKPSTSLASDRLTKSEVEQLRQDLKDKIAFARKTRYPNLKTA